MRYLLLFILTLSIQTFANDALVASYQDKLNSFNKKMQSTKSVLTTADKKAMKDAGDYLFKSLPNPGIYIGEVAPNFTLSNAFGKKITLADELKKGPVVLIFYRGAWCPYCNLQLHALQESLPILNQYNARLITVTPQKPDQSAKQLAKDGFQFEVLSDLDSKVMKDYKLYFELPDALLTIYKKFDIDIEVFNGEGRNVLPVPASFVIDQKGIVRAMMASTNYQKRMEPQAIIDALKML